MARRVKGPPTNQLLPLVTTSQRYKDDVDPAVARCMYVCMYFATGLAESIFNICRFDGKRGE